MGNLKLEMQDRRCEAGSMTKAGSLGQKCDNRKQEAKVRKCELLGFTTAGIIGGKCGVKGRKWMCEQGSVEQEM